LATADEEVDLAVALLECTIGVAPFGRRRWSSFLSIVVMVIVVVLATSIITLIISSVIALVVMDIISTITPVVVTLVVAVIAMVVIASVITMVVTTIITSIPVIVARIGPAITVISSITSTVTVVETLAAVPIITVVAPSPLGGSRDSKGALQLLALPHVMLGVAVKLALVIHDPVEVTFEEGRRFWWIRHIGFAKSLAPPGASIVVVFSVEVMHRPVLSVEQFVDVSHEVTKGVCVYLVDLLKQLDAGDPILVISDDDFILYTCKGVAVLEVAVGVLSESFITSHAYSGEVVSFARTIIGHLVVVRENARQCCPGGDALCWEIIEPQEWCLTHHKGEVSRHVVFTASRGTCCNAVHLEPYTRVRAIVVLLNSRLEILWVSDHLEM
jgi:hypothetical protein